MKYLKVLALLGFCLMVTPYAHAQRIVVGLGVGPEYVGPPPVCAYGYYGDYPYACAPNGYYGPSWFSGGVFIGAGPWYHHFYGRPGYNGRPGYRYGGGYRGPAYGGHGNFGRGPGAYHGGNSFRGGGSFHGGGGNFRSGGGFHGGGGGGHGGRH